jgi:UDP-N-acetyl-D-glucosamine dehydrogenase
MKSKRTPPPVQRVAIVGLGYVGLPLALLFCGQKLKVIAYDEDAARIKLLKAGKSPIRHVAGDRIAEAVRSRHLLPTTRAQDLGKADAVILCVPTPLTKQREPDLDFVRSASATVAAHAKKGVLVVLESTTYPGTTKEVIAPYFEARGWKLGRDFFLAYSPEREDPNNASFSTATIPKLLGGAEPKSLERALSLYSRVIRKVVPVTSMETAEAAKLLENIFRAVNIALVNELKIVFDRMGIDVWEVIDAAKTKPFGFMAFYPGPGLGGHCIPIDPFYLTWKAREFDLSTKFIELAGEINTQMPYFVVSKVQQVLSQHGKALNKSKIMLLGLAYKKDIDDLRESPSLKLMDILEREGSQVVYHDPFIPAFAGDRHFRDLKARPSQPFSKAAFANVDVVLICTNHSQVDYGQVKKWASLIVDTRNVLPPDGRKVFRA